MTDLNKIIQDVFDFKSKDIADKLINNDKLLVKDFNTLIIKLDVPLVLKIVKETLILTPNELKWIVDEDLSGLIGEHIKNV